MSDLRGSNPLKASTSFKVNPQASTSSACVTSEPPPTRAPSTRISETGLHDGIEEVPISDTASTGGRQSTHPRVRVGTTTSDASLEKPLSTQTLKPHTWRKGLVVCGKISNKLMGMAACCCCGEWVCETCGGLTDPGDIPSSPLRGPEINAQLAPGDPSCHSKTCFC
ncbi:hypothetical protein M231_05707 [Tremella mesenterica]|uniref:Uncharacterized protein n=1 Tax=Tremella mesenterica TaxID=5217 RepID=A0A4Q1BHD4_TREME|nr:hypothetical protein M231_05707 [Tremella mesenterica]